VMDTAIERMQHRSQEGSLHVMFRSQRQQDNTSMPDINRPSEAAEFMGTVAH
jgi:hypothetical protein